MVRHLPFLLKGLIAAVIAAVTTTAAAEPGAPTRIVSIGGAVSEIVHALGFEDRIVAVDSTSRYPPALMKKPNVGYMRRLAAEPIIALSPDLVLFDGDSGPPTALRQLRAAGIKLVRVPAEPTVPGILKKIRVVAETLGVAAKGAALAQRLDAELASAAAIVATAGSRPQVLFLLSTGRGVPLAGGHDTSADAIIHMAGGVNAITTFANYKPLTPEAAVSATPDVILVTDRSLRLIGGEARLLALPEIAATPAARAGRVVSMDGLLLLGFGPRTGEAVLTLARGLHPSLGGEAGTR